MRVTGGALARRAIKCPDGVIRPAMDRMRESVFAVLGDLSGASFLDLFSGSGVIAIEAASRGAASVELCEKDKIKIPTVIQNVSITEKELGVKIKCHFMPVEYFLKRCKNSFDFVFLDPPFAYKFHQALVEQICANGILREGGQVIVHRPQELSMPEKISGLARVDRRSYGRSIVDFYGSADRLPAQAGAENISGRQK